MSKLKEEYLKAKLEYENIKRLKSEKVEVFLDQKSAEGKIDNMDAKNLEEFDRQFNEEQKHIILLVEKAKIDLEHAENNLLELGMVILDKGLQRYYCEELKKKNADRDLLKQEILEMIIQRI